MPQTFKLPPGFSTAPPNAAPSGTFALPPGFSTAPPTAKPVTGPMPAPNPVDQAIGSLPLIGQIYGAGKTAMNALNAGGTPGPNERRGELAPVIRNEQTGALRLAWPQLALDAASAFQLPGDVASGRTELDPRVSFSQQDPKTLDRAAALSSMVGLDGPMAGLGMTPAQAVVMQDGKTLPRILASDLTRSNIPAGQVSSEISALGPDAVLGDVSPILQSRVGYLAKTPGEAQQTIFDTLSARQQAAGPRIKGALADIAGPEPIPSVVNAGIEARKALIGPYYDKLFQTTNARVNAEPLVANLNGNVAMLRGPAQSALAKVRAMFNVAKPIADATGQTITNDPRTLFEIRNAIDGMMATEANPKTLGALGAFRKRLDITLGAAVPGLKQLDAYWQEQERQLEGFNYGRAALNTAAAAPIHPDDLAAEMQKVAMQSSTGPMSQPSQYPTMIRQGMLSKMYEIVGNNSNDRLSLKKIITGDGKWNYDKISSAFGPTKARQLLDLFRNEATKAETENLAMANSKTARVMAGGQGLEPVNGPGMLRSALNMDFGDAALRLGSKVTGGMFDARRAARNAALADMLMTPASGFSPVPVPRIPPSAIGVRAIEAGMGNGLIDWHRRVLEGRN